MSDGVSISAHIQSFSETSPLVMHLVINFCSVNLDTLTIHEANYGAPDWDEHYFFDFTQKTIRGWSNEMIDLTIQNVTATVNQVATLEQNGYQRICSFLTSLHAKTSAVLGESVAFDLPIEPSLSELKQELKRFKDLHDSFFSSFKASVLDLATYQELAAISDEQQKSLESLESIFDALKVRLCGLHDVWRRALLLFNGVLCCLCAVCCMLFPFSTVISGR
jgi:hypothetical protein